MQKTRLFGTPSEERFDKLTRLACRLFGVSMSMLNVIGTEMVWVKSAQGVDITKSPTKDSYCYYACAEDGDVIIPDARIDPRTSDNRYSASFIFYAGVPIRHESHVVGVFCIADTSPRVLSQPEIEQLRDIASLAETEFHMAALSATQLRLVRENEELATKAQVDDLTRVWNRGAILTILASELAEADATHPVGVIMIDLDHFKSINDTFGHPGGDEVLRRMSERLRGLVKPWDAVGRFGGEEFIVVLSRCGESDVVGVAERFRRALACEPILYEEHLIFATASFGVAWSDGAEPSEALVKLADARLYEAKRLGRDRVVGPHETDRKRRVG